MSSPWARMVRLVEGWLEVKLVSRLVVDSRKSGIQDGAGIDHQRGVSNSHDVSC